MRNFGNARNVLIGLNMGDPNDQTTAGGQSALVTDPTGVLWERMRAGPVDVPSGGSLPIAALTGLSDAVALVNLGNTQQPSFLCVGALPYGINAAGKLDRVHSVLTSADALASVVGNLSTAAFPFLYNGATFDRARNNSAANIAATTQGAALMTAGPGQWATFLTPAAATQATITKAAGAAGVRHVCTAIHGRLIVPPTVNQPKITLNLRDGASGAGSILWSASFGLGVAAGDQGYTQDVSLSGLAIFGTAATAMTLEFSGAGAGTTFESVAVTGYSTI